VKYLIKCPRCGQEVEYFFREKPHDPALICPACMQYINRREIPSNVKFKVKYLGEEDRRRNSPQEEAQEEVVEEDSEKPQKKISRKTEPPPLFEEIKEPTQIINEILLDWGCEEDFVKKITEYINMKGYFDPAWMMNMLLRARTGRKFTEQEAFMIVDMIISALEKEKRKSEETGRIFPLTIMSLRTGFPTYMGSTQILQPYTPQTLGYTYMPPQTPSITTTQMPMQTPQYMQSTSQLTPQAIQEMIKQAIMEYKRESDIDEIKKLIMNLEKRRVEDKSELEKKIMEKHEEILKTVEKIFSSITGQLQPQETTIDKKDIELMKMEFEKSLSEKLANLEKKYIESKNEAEKRMLLSQIKSLEEKIEEVKREASRPVSAEGWQKDETRLIAELGARALDIIREKKPIEYVVRILPTQPQQPQQQKTEKTLIEMIKESGGVVE